MQTLTRKHTTRLVEEKQKHTKKEEAMTVKGDIVIMIGREDIEIEPALGLEVDLDIGSAHTHDQNPVMTRGDCELDF
mgnify:CR=1 FL=1